MRKSVYIISSIVLLMFLLSCDDGNSDNNSQNTNQNAGDVTGNSNSKVYKVPAELSYISKKEGFSYDKFYPIGWSDDGKFAYIVEPADEGSGLYFFEIHVYDIVNNKDIWAWKYEGEDGESVQSVWNKNTELFHKNLNEHNIAQNKKFNLQKGKMSHQGNDYEIVMDSKLETDQDFGIDIIKGVKLTMKSPQLGTKDFFEQQMDNRES